MENTPNYDTILNLAKQLEDEYDIKTRLERYKSLNPELITFAETFELNSDDAPKALFISDFIVTHTEIIEGTSEEIRRESIIKSFKIGLNNRSENSSALMRVFYLSQKVAQSIRRNDYFLAGRGLKRDISLVIFKDIFLTPYLEVCNEILGNGPVGWELGVFASAVTHELPDKMIEKYINISSENLLEAEWEILTSYSKFHKVEQNETFSISNVKETKLILIDKFSKLANISLFNISKSVNLKENEIVENLLSFLESTDNIKPLIYMNTSIIGTDLKLFLLRNIYTHGKPFTLIQTKADEINVSKVMKFLELRGAEKDDWYRIFGKQRKAVQRKTVSELKEFTVEKEIEVDSFKEVEVEQKEKSSIISKIRRIFKKKTAKSTVSKKKIPIKEKKKIKTKEKRKVTKQVRDEIPMLNIIPDFVGGALTVIALGDLNLVEIWDTYRESDYIIIGVLESDLVENKTTFITDDQVGDPKELIKTLEGLDTVIEQTIQMYMDINSDIIPNEIVFLSNIGDKSVNTLILFESNKERLVGTIAITYMKDISMWLEKLPETVNRRTLQRRTRQLLSARAHTPLDTSIERILGDTISKKVQEKIIDTAIFTIQK